MFLDFGEIVVNRYRNLMHYGAFRFENKGGFVKISFILAILCFTCCYAQPAQAGCSCQATYAVPAGAGDVTITKVKVSTVQYTFGDIYITLPYGRKWKGSKKINSGKRAKFTFNVSSGCENGTRRFAFTRKDGKTCYGLYNPPHNYDRCGLNSSSHKRTAPTISCEPDQWRTTSPG